MLGLFNMSIFGRFVVNGDDPVGLLWDLFDQIVLQGNVVTHVGGATMIINNPNVPPLDSEERRALHGTPAWVTAHSHYFLSKLADGSALFPFDLPQELFFKLHCTRMLGAVLESRGSAGDHLMRMNIIGFRYGWGTQEYHERMAELPNSDYPYPDLSPSHLINFMLLKGVLELKEAGRAAQFGILSLDEVHAAQQRAREETARLKVEQRQASMECRQRQRARKPRKS